MADEKLADRGAVPAETPHRWTATFNPKFGAKIWFGGRPMFAVIAVAEDCKVSDADPVPQWQKCVDAVVETMNRTAAASAPAVPHPPEQAGGVLTQHCLDGHHGACTNPFCGCECHVPAEAPRPAATPRVGAAAATETPHQDNDDENLARGDTTGG